MHRLVNCGQNSEDANNTMILRPPSHASTTVAWLETDEQSAHRIADLAAETFPADEIAVALVDIGAGRWRVAMHFRAAPDEKIIHALVAAAAGDAAVEALRFERVAAKDWVRESLAGLAPVTAGRFVVHGAHDRARIPLNRIGIEIEAALAFGTGHHGTTRGCLLALDRLLKARRIRRVLDVGTGTGVLAIAAARALRCRVLASDIDPVSVRVARDNARLNHVAMHTAIIRADGLGDHRLRACAPFG